MYRCKLKHCATTKKGLEKKAETKSGALSLANPPSRVIARAVKWREIRNAIRLSLFVYFCKMSLHFSCFDILACVDLALRGAHLSNKDHNCSFPKWHATNLGTSRCLKQFVATKCPAQ
jgi:hypothetical protein